MDPSSESNNWETCKSSTPLYIAEKFVCSLSSISSNSTSSTSTKIKTSFTAVKSKYTIDNEDENKLVESDHSERKNEQPNYARRIGEAIREEIIMLPDIQPDHLRQLFPRSELNNLVYNKSLDESFIESELPILENESSFNGVVGEHFHTYTRAPLRKNRISPPTIKIHFNTATSDFAWENFIQDEHPPKSCKKRKHVNCFFMEQDKKFFKTQRQFLQQQEETYDSLSKKKKIENLRFEGRNLSILSFKRPLGWMAIKGIGIEERREICDGIMATSRNSSIKPYTSVSKKKKINSQ